MTERANSMTGGAGPRPPVGELTVAAGVARALVDLAAKKGARREALLRRAGLDPLLLREQDNRVPLERYAALLRAAREACGDPALALHFGEAVDLSEMSIVGLLEGARTLAEAFAQVNRYASLVMETGGAGPRLVAEHRGGRVWIVDTRPNPNEFPEITESAFARMVCGERRFFGGRQRLRAVHVTHPAPPYRAEYERVFAAPVVFESDRNALVYDASWWAESLPDASPYRSRVLAAHADRLLQELEASRSTRGRVERLLLEGLESGGTSMARVAAELGLARKTLLRRLKAEGVTFARVLDELRRAVAIDCLRRGLAVNETAYRAGFSDPAPFSRAFKRWTGCPPRTFAAEARAGQRGAPKP